MASGKHRDRGAKFANSRQCRNPEKELNPTYAPMNASSLRELQPELVLNDNGLSSARARWSPIAERTVYFGHQLIGGEIVSGINELAREHALPLSVIHAREPATVTSPTFVHFLAGQNGDYASKNACLLRLLESKTRA